MISSPYTHMQCRLTLHFPYLIYYILPEGSLEIQEYISLVSPGKLFSSGTRPSRHYFRFRPSSICQPEGIPRRSLTCVLYSEETVVLAAVDILFVFFQEEIQEWLVELFHEAGGIAEACWFLRSKASARAEGR